MGNIRVANKADIPELLRMAENFYNASGYNKHTEFDQETATDVGLKLISDNTLLTDGNAGMIGFIVFPFFFNRKTLIAQELFWWVDEESRGTKLGLNLLSAAEKKATELGAKKMIMLSINGLGGKMLSNLYQSLGYEPIEQSYLRSL